MKKLTTLLFLSTVAILFSFQNVIAQEQSSNTVVTKVGDPPVPQAGNGQYPPPGPASSSISQTAINMASILKSSCGGVVNSGNYDCARSIFGGGVLYPDLAYNEITVSASNYSFLQCIGFVNAVIGGATGVAFPKIGNAADYDQDVSGFSFIPKGGTISAGDIVVWDNGGDGHIAIVVEVYDQDTIQTAEGNFDYKGGVDLRNRVISQESTLRGWLRKI